MATYDLLVFQHPGDGVVRLTSQSLYVNGQNGVLVTGMQKLIQSWLLEFLTVPGTSGFHLRDRGTFFIPTLQASIAGSELGIRSAFNFAAARIYENFRKRYTSTTPPEERLGPVSLDNIVISPGFLQLKITITNSLGESGTVTAPISTLSTVLP
jgi:hypothetical protein